jgi:hypothetical protein
VSVFVNRAQTHQRQLDAKQRGRLTRGSSGQQALVGQADAR